MIIVDKYLVVKSHNTHRNKVSFCVSCTDKECLLSNGSDCVRKPFPANFSISDYTYSLKSGGEFATD